MSSAPHPVVATGGRYAALADYAAAHGLTMYEAQKHWHQHRPDRRQRLPNRRPSVTFPVRWQTDAGAQSFTLTAGFDPDTAQLAEVFYADGQRSGSGMQHTVQDACTVISIALQHGVTVAELAHSIGRVPMAGGTAPASLIGAILDALGAV